MSIETEIERLRESVHKRRNEIGLLNAQMVGVQKDIEGVKMIEEIQNKTIEQLLIDTRNIRDRQLVEQGARDHRSGILKWLMSNWFTLFLVAIFVIIHVEWDKFLQSIK